MSYGLATLVVDASGVGLPIVDLLRLSGARPVAIVITGGRSICESDGVLRVPKRDLVITLAGLLESGRLQIASDIPNASELIRELLGFQVRINQRTKRETYQAGKHGTHDDLVLALALGCWYAEKEERIN
jgi:hypothetical protein